DPTRSFFIVTGNHTYAEARLNPYTITVFITSNSAGALAQQPPYVTDVVTINDALLTPGVALPIFTTENQPLNNVAVATFTAANPGATAADFSATITWGDGPTPTADPNTRIALVGGSPAGPVFAVFGSHVYQSVGATGKFSTEVTVLDEDSPVGASISVPPVAA